MSVGDGERRVSLFSVSGLNCVCVCSLLHRCTRLLFPST